MRKSRIALQIAAIALAASGSLLASAEAGMAQPATQTAAAKPDTKVLVRTEILNFDNWTVTCREYRQVKGKECSATLQLFESKSHQAVFSWTIGTEADGKPVALLQTPTGVTIGPGVLVKLEKGGERKVAYVSCMPGFCTASMPVDSALVRDMMATKQAEIVIQAATGQKLDFKVPMEGFDKAYAALRQP